MRRYVMCVLLLFSYFFAQSQNAAIDSLQQLICKQKEDTDKVNTLIRLSAMLRALSEPTQSIEQSNNSLALATKLNFGKGKGMAYRELGFANTTLNAAASLCYHQLSLQCFMSINNKKEAAYSIIYIGTYYSNRRNYTEALTYYSTALKQLEELKDKEGIAQCYRWTGRTYSSMQNKPEAIKFYYRALAVFEELKNRNMVAECFFQLGITHQMQADFQGAIVDYQQAVDIYKAIGNKYQFVLSSGNLGNAYRMLHQYNKALEVYLEAEKVVKELGSPDLLIANIRSGAGEQYRELGALCAARGDDKAANEYYAKALKNFKEGMAASEKINNQSGVSNNYWHFGVLYQYMGKYDLARGYLQKCLSLSLKLNYKNNIALSYDYLAQVDSLQGDYKAAFTHYRAYMEYRDSTMINDTMMRKLSEAKGRFEFIRKEDSLRVQQQLTNEKLKQQQLLAIQQQQQLQLQQASLKLSSQQKELTRLDFLHAQSLLQAEQNKRQQKEKQLLIAEKEKALELSQLKLKTTELGLKENEIRAKRSERNVIVAASFSILMFGAAFWINNRKKQKAYNLLEKQRMRTQIASDLHDDIGSSLTSISFYSQMVKMQVADENSSVKPMLDKIANNARTIVNTMSDIVWVINPDNDITENLIRRMRNHACELCTERDIAYEFQADDESKGLNLNMQQRKNFYLIYKEALHNAVKYAGCDKININLSQTSDEIKLVVKDNGKGFDVSNAKDGNGLTNMKRRADEIRAILNLETCPANGTLVSLKLKIT
jgi:two-component system, NarL family, sensor histidine kinase UhpB